MATSVPSKIGKYDVLGVIGRGGMGIVYKAIDPRLDRDVAIKMMTGGFVDDPDLRKRFFREAQSLANLQHPNIVTVYDLGDYEGNPYLVMQYLEGETLDVAMAQRRKLSLLEKFNIIIQVCSGLAYSHKRFVVHRDIKPANIMLEKDGGTKIFDFGIAHVGDQSVTKTGQMVGTPPYMSPEQINGKTIDARSDVFSVGVVLYQLLTDHLPFQGDSPAGTFLKILYDPIPPLKTYLPSYPQELDAILERALAKDPADRYHSADEFALDVAHLLSQFRQEVVDRQMREVGFLLEKSELHKARELLLQVLKVDPKHLPATQSLRDVERRIKKEEIGRQIRRLRQQADEALSQRQLEVAQSLLEQALAIDNTDPDLRQHAESVRAAIVQARKLREALRAAESAHQDGDLDIAKQAIEEAVQIAPNDTQAKALYRVVQREWLERSRQRQIETYFFQARQHISARKFTDALETLNLAEALDPGAPQIHSLMETATAGLEQERRRKEIEAAVREIESALNSDDYRGACQNAEEALRRFPEERTIIKLKALAERERQIEERRQLVEEQLALARELLQVNRNDELLASLEATIAKIGPEPRLQSLRAIVTENVQRERLERRKSEALQQARELLRNQQYDSAIRKLESARAELRNEPELDDLLQFVKEEAAAEKRRRETEAVAQKARAFVAEQKYDDAIRVLESALQQNTDRDLRIALAETRSTAAEYHEKMETALVSVEKMLQARKFVEAVKLLESHPPAYFRNPSFSKQLESARSQGDRMRRVREVVDQSQHVCDNGDYVGAHRVLDEWRQRNGTEPELDAQGALIEQRRIDAACRTGEKAIGDARDLISRREYQAGLDKLQSVVKLVADLPEAMAKEYRSLRQVAATGLVDSPRNQIEESVDRGELTRAGNILRQALMKFPGESNLSELGKVVQGEQGRLQAEKRRLEEKQRLKEEELQKQEQLHKERELAKRQEQEHQEHEKARKREEHERKEAAAAEKHKQEQGAKRLREEERREEALRKKDRKAAPIPVPPHENGEMSATRVLSTPEPPAVRASVKTADRSEKELIPQAGQLASVSSGTRKAIFVGAVLLLVAGAVVLWRILVPHTIAIQVTSIPDGASVTITAPNQPKFKRECVTPRCRLDLDPGPYAVEIRHEGFERSTQTIQVDANGAHSFPVTLVATATPGEGISTEKMVDLQVRGLKDGSELYVDGKLAGRVGHRGEIVVQVPAGEHRVKVLAKNETSIIVARNFVAGQVVSLGREEFLPPTALALEDVDWQKMLESTPTLDSLEKFLQKYPSGTHRADAWEMLESLYWDKDSHANTAGSYGEYLGHFPHGPHVAAAAEELAYLDAYSQKDPASLDAFVSRYGSSRHRAEIDGLRDEAAWQRTNRGDENSLGAYLSSFPEGKHTGEAKGRLGELRDEAAWQRTNRDDENGLYTYLKAFPGGKYSEVASELVAKIHASANGGGAKPPRPSQKELDDAAIRTLLKGYESAFDTRNVDALLKIWPSMGTKEYRKLKDMFAAVNSMSMQVQIRDIELSGTGDTATANTFMSQSAKVSGGGGNQPPPHKDHAVFELTKTNGNWIIKNVR